MRVCAVCGVLFGPPPFGFGNRDGSLAHQVRREQDLGAVLQQVLQRGDGGADARVIRDLQRLVERHVQVRAHEHALALKVRLRQIADGLLRRLHHQAGAGEAHRRGKARGGHAAAGHARRRRAHLLHLERHCVGWFAGV